MTKSKPQVKIIDCLTGKEIIQDASAEQIAEFEKIAIEKTAAQAELEAKAQAKADLLAKLGITQEEANLLLS